eukprot:COSAG02_NODE_27720_length_604_cov_0.603960_1_plen_30_part_01
MCPTDVSALDGGQIAAVNPTATETLSLAKN